jgi:hypothetical protein
MSGAGQCWQRGAAKIGGCATGQDGGLVQWRGAKKTNQPGTGLQGRLDAALAGVHPCPTARTHFGRRPSLPSNKAGSSYAAHLLQ